MDEPSSKRAAAAIAAAALGGLWYLLLQGWTPHFFFGVFFDVFYLLWQYLVMPVAFSGALMELGIYLRERLRGYAERDWRVALPLFVSVAMMFYVAAPLMGEVGIFVATAVFLAFRMGKRYL